MMHEILLGLNNAKYNDINSIVQLLNNNKKILLVGKVDSGKTYTLNYIKEKCAQKKFVYLDNNCYNHMQDISLFLNSSKGSIATIRGIYEKLALHEFAELLRVSKSYVKYKLDYIIIIKDRNCYEILDTQSI